VVNAPFIYTIQASEVATSFSAAGLPSGLTLNSVTGAITGTNTSSGTFSVTLTAANSTGQTTNTLTLVIYNGAPPAPGITSALTATGTIAADFNYLFTATNDPTSYFVIGLPPGLCLIRRAGAFLEYPPSREISS